MDLDAFRGELDSWLDDHDAELRPPDSHRFDDHMAHLSTVKRLTYDASFMRWGWPESVGGLGGSTLLRGYLGGGLTARGLVEPGIYSMTEVLVPTMIDYAPPGLAAEMVPRQLRGDETWCQGFSEPSTGSNLGALACRATRSSGGEWRVTGQKVWTSLAQFAQRCVLLTRTGSPEDAHRGITAFFVDMDSPGITVRPIRTMHGVDEFCEVFFDDVAVPHDRMLGAEGQGWAVAMDLLPFERSTALWHRGAYLHRKLSDLLAAAPEGSLSAADVGAVIEQLYAFRARSRATQYRMAAGEKLGAETSIDKLMLGMAEQALYDVAAAALAPALLAGDDPESEGWRSEYLYSRAATIYGGSSEIQRNIVARRLLDLGPEV
ncbi:MAG: acyl-CoA dehydrogenase family protein [Frankiaceae bacterium]|nr:acyl-CoA dehydrogenase family protein [Frankiaceae bacterium]